MIRTLPGFLGLQSDWDFLPWPHSATEGEVLMGYSMGGGVALDCALAHLPGSLFKLSIR